MFVITLLPLSLSPHSFISLMAAAAAGSTD
jgi:hypothetical protein